MFELDLAGLRELATACGRRAWMVGTPWSLANLEYVHALAPGVVIALLDRLANAERVGFEQAAFNGQVLVERDQARRTAGMLRCAAANALRPVDESRLASRPVYEAALRELAQAVRDVPEEWAT